MEIKIALPKGRLLVETAGLLKNTGWGLRGYNESLRSYRLNSRKFPELLAKVFHEKDIPVQVAVGNYDLGICGLDWIEELLVKYPSSALVKLRNLGYGQGALYMVASQSDKPCSLSEIRTKRGTIRLASEYPNLAESFALKNRLRAFNVFSVWGAAEAYPPESADLALVSGNSGEGGFNNGLVPVDKVLGYSAYLIANRDSWEEKDLSQLLETFENGVPFTEKTPSPLVIAESPGKGRKYVSTKVDKGMVRLALPDGHQQGPTVNLLNKTGIDIEDYPSQNGNRRPKIGLEGVSVKVIRPQDMPLQVANGNFDIAITGRDWLKEHLNRFPSSPVTELADLKFGWVKIVAVVSKEVPVDDISDLRKFYAGQSAPVRIASEYTNIADKFARDRQLGKYRIIPTWGASEAFLPEDADLLIENTETGSTIARHNLKIVDTLFESTACLIGHKGSVSSAAKGRKIKSIIEILLTAVDKPD